MSVGGCILRPMTTIFELLYEAAGPVLETVPVRPSCRDIYDPDATDAAVERLRFPFSGSSDPADLVTEIEAHNAFMARLHGTPMVDGPDLSDAAMCAFELMLRGPIRLMVSGVYSGAAAPLDIRCYADRDAGVVWNHGEEAIAVRGGHFPEVLDIALGFLPRERPGRSAVVQVPAGPGGMIPEGFAADVDRLRSFLARPRHGTAIFDMLAFHNIFAEFPVLGFVVIDNALGRHVLASWEAGMVLRPVDDRWLSWWLRRCVEAVTVNG